MLRTASDGAVAAHSRSDDEFVAAVARAVASDDKVPYSCFAWRSAAPQALNRSRSFAARQGIFRLTLKTLATICVRCAATTATGMIERDRCFGCIC